MGIWKAAAIGSLAAVSGIVAVIIGIVAVFLFAIFGALMGAFTGFILGIAPIIGPLVKEGFASVGVANPSLVAIGAMLGFIAGFFKQSWSDNKHDGWKQ